MRMSISLKKPESIYIIATDISPKMIDIAKSRPEIKELDNITFKVSSVEDLEIEEGSLDVVFTLSILHLLKEPEDTLQAIYKMLKPGGLLISSTTCISDIMPVFKLIGPLFYYLGIFPFVNVFSEEDLKSYIQNAGFTIDYDWKRKNKKEGKDSAVFIIAKK
jgi:ubiquinone/menaquinone biosynthesis C-methylase UbiE